MDETLKKKLTGLWDNYALALVQMRRAVSLHSVTVWSLSLGEATAEQQIETWKAFLDEREHLIKCDDALMQTYRDIEFLTDQRQGHPPIHPISRLDNEIS